MDPAEKNIFQEGKLLLINKPLEWTSFDVVKKINRLLHGVKVGHAGTLDPLATGLLILCTGKFTKKINEYMAAEKEYRGSFTVGAKTPTYDLESEPGDFMPYDGISQGTIRAAALRMTGDIWQVPPAHSAIKRNGQRAYQLARRGEEVKLGPRKIQIREFEIGKIELPLIYFRVVCSTGTYIRSLAQDLGTELGCGAYLSSLCRTRIGVFSLDDAMTMPEAEAMIRESLTNQNG